LQRSGGKLLLAEQFLQSMPIEVGDVFNAC
jgi:hypothetical protein